MSAVGHRSPPSMRTTSDRRRVSRSRRILAWLTATGLAIGDQSTPFAPCRMRWHSDLGRTTDPWRICYVRAFRAHPSQFIPTAGAHP